MDRDIWGVHDIVPRGRQKLDLHLEYQNQNMAQMDRNEWFTGEIEGYHTSHTGIGRHGYYRCAINDRQADRGSGCDYRRKVSMVELCVLVSSHRVSAL